MTDTHELETPVPPEPDPRPPVRRRVLLGALAVGTVAVLVTLFVTVTGGDGRQVAATATSTPPAPPAPTTAPPDEAGRDTNDPLAPQNRSTLAPDAGSSTEAAVRNNWPLVARDEFDGTSLNTSLWDTYTGQTTGGVGRHDPRNISVADGSMTITSHGRSSAGMAWDKGQKYGRWEVRARVDKGTGYGAVILLWPDAEDFPKGGEIDFAEIPNGQRNEAHFVLHYGRDNSQVGTTTPGDFTQWHNYAVEWAPDHVAGFIDGQEIFRSTKKAAVPPRSMHLAIQQDIGPYGKNWIPPRDRTTPDKVRLQVDWVRIYGL